MGGRNWQGEVSVYKRLKRLALASGEVEEEKKLNFRFTARAKTRCGFSQCRTTLQLMDTKK
jgi:hypothetical protein